MIFNISLFLSMTDKYSYTTQRKFRNVYCICPSYGYLERKDVSQQRSVTANKFHSKEGSQQRNLTAKKPNSKEVSQQRSLTAKKPHSEEASQQTSFTAKKSHSKEASQQTSFTAKKSHRKEASQQRSPTAKKPHSKEASQQRSLTAKKSHSKEVSQQRSLARKLRFQKFQLQFLREAPHESFAFPSCSCKFRGSGFTTSMYTIYLRLGCRDQDRRSFFLANVNLCFFVTVLASRVGLLLCVVVAQVVLWPLWSLAACCLQIAYWNCRAKGPEMS